jgi:polyphenol oxidase
MRLAPNLSALPWIVHGFGCRTSKYPPKITVARQVHSSIVLHAAGIRGGCAGEGDALVSNEPGVLVGIRTADCIPVLLADPQTRSVAAIHSGWRGAAADIAGAAVRELVTSFEARPEDLHAAVGPGIGPCCYEVGAEVAQRFAVWLPEYAEAATPIRIDLPRIVERQLRAAGVRDIWAAGECTFCNPDKYFSFRRDRENAGRMLSFIGIDEPSSATAA